MKKRNNNTLRRIRLSPGQAVLAAQRYADGETTVSIARSYGVCCNAICNAIRKSGGQIRDRATRATKYVHRPDAFDSITDESAYWIGFLFADGSVPRHKTRLVLTVGLRASDREHLEKLKRFIGSSHPLYDTTATIRGRTHKGVRLTLAAPRLVTALRAWGMKLSLDRVAPEELLYSKHFWRGAVDGDGHVGTGARTRESGITYPTPRLDLCGGRILMEQFLRYLQANDIGHRTSIGKQGVLYRVRIGTGTAVKAMRLLYVNEMPFLDRKFHVVGRILGVYDKGKP